MVTNKTFEELSEGEIRCAFGLNCIDAKNYLLYTHGEICFEGFLKRFVPYDIENLTPLKIINQNRRIQYFRVLDQNPDISPGK